MDGPPHARPAVAAAGGRGEVTVLSGGRRADNDAGVHRNIHATVTAGNDRAVTAVAVTVFTTATATAFTSTASGVKAAGVTVLGGASGVYPYPLEDDPGFGHADDALVGNAGEAALFVASDKR